MGELLDGHELGVQPAEAQRRWLDLHGPREVFHVSAPTLCAEGVLAAAARALMDPRVKE